MNKKISQFELTTHLQDHDLITLVQDQENRNIAGGDFITSLSSNFATNTRVDGLEDDILAVDTKVDTNYTDLSNKIIEGDTSVTTNLNSTITSYYDVLNNKIITLEVKHDGDFSRVNNTVQEWIDDIDNRSTIQQLEEALNRLTVAENTITALADLLANGGGSGDVVGFHTQPTSTIFPLSGYFKGVDASPLATTDTLNQALSKLENQVEAISDTSGYLPLIKIGETTPPSDHFIYTSGKVAEDYLNKKGDTATGKITFLEGLQAGREFRQGWDGVGASLYPVSSKWNLEVDNLFVRGNMTVNELTVNEIKAVGGDILVTVADMKCTEVKELADSYQCFFDTEDGTVYNQFLANDLAICQKFDGKNVKRYWRKVNAVGDDCIYLSKDVCEPGSGVPEAEDNILQLGHMFEADPDYNTRMDERRNAIFISAKGENAPRITYYKNIDTFSLADEDGVVRERVVIGGEETKFVGTIYQTSDTGIVRVPVYRGIWLQGTTYYYYDQVSYEGSLWICMAPNGTVDPPSESDDEWQKQVAKGDAGKPSDDVAKWIEIIGDRLFLFDSPDFTGTPTPGVLTLTANVYGMTDPSFEWIMLTQEETPFSNQQTVVFPYTAMPSDSRTLRLRCNVTNSDGGQYYDEVQLAKLANGAEGLDAYYIDLSNGTVAIPFAADGVTPQIDISTVKTEVFAYHGINPIAITNITTNVSEGTATVSVNDTIVSLVSLGTTNAKVDLGVTLADGVTITKTWYIGKTVDGNDGFNGEDATYVYMSGEQFFHYTNESEVPNPTTITLTCESFNIMNPSYQWYWAIAGTYDWQILANETRSTLVVSYNGIYFTSSNADEVTFKCEVTGDGMSYYDFMTINKIRDGEDVYRASLPNENTSVPASANGSVIDYSSGSTRCELRKGKKRYENNEFLVRWSTISGTGTLSYNSTTQTLSLTSMTTDSVVFKVDFYQPADSSTIVDSVDFSITKQRFGENGATGKNAVQIFCNTSGSTPSRPTFSYRPSSSGASSGGYNWYPNPSYSSSYTTWMSTGYYDSDAGSMAYDSTVGGYWTAPVKQSGKDGEQGPQGPQGPQGATGSPGSNGWNGPSLNYMGAYSSSTTYGWTVKPDVRDVVKYNNVYYMVAERQRGITFSYVTPTNTDFWEKFGTSFTSVATGLLFAEKATIAGMDFYNNCIQAQSGRFFLDGRLSSDNAGNPIFSCGNNASTDGVPSKTAALKIFGGGTLTVGDGAINSNAGITGAGTASSSVRFWAGASFGNNVNAPFKVMQDGSMVASNASITGNITAKTANFTGNVSVGSLTGWNIPGVKTISHYGNNYRQTVYSQGNCQITSINRTGTGTYTVYHNVGHTNYTVLWQGLIRHGGSDSFRGTIGVGSISSSSFTIICVDTDNNRHDVGQPTTELDFIILGYAQG